MTTGFDYAEYYRDESYRRQVKIKELEYKVHQANNRTFWVFMIFCSLWLLSWDF